LLQSIELPPEPKNQILLTLNFQYRTNYSLTNYSLGLIRSGFCPTWHTRGNPVSILFI
ncbi:Os05g0429802, partial [Oryza sativa Japonica Group]